MNAIVHRSVAANRADWQAAPSYSYLEREVDQNGGTKTYHVRMIRGSPYRELVAVNGEPLPPERQAQEQSRMTAAIAHREAESPSETARRIANYEKERRRDEVLLNQLVQAFDFKLQGEQSLDGRNVYVLRATPRQGYIPPNRDSQVLTGMRGKLWIDTATFQWVKVEAEVVRPVWIEGFLAKVEPGTRFDLEYAPVSGGIWLPKHYGMKSRAKVLFLFTSREQEDDTYYDYRNTAETAQR
ncbi:MAG: hypothetical protein LAP38_25985 [Acidobacteriia bacterium]|nr:hypothetical protein [Terriglobia bacterium]